MVILSTAYLPNVHYFTKLLGGGEVRIEAHETYPKQTYRNRCQILGANGVLQLSIPVKKVLGNRTPIMLVEIENDTLWQKNHWRTIESAYRNAPFFDFLADELLPFYSRRYSNLWEFNTSLMRALLAFVGSQPAFESTPTYVATYGADAADFRSVISPKVSFGADAQFAPVPYFQVFGSKFGFVPNLSVVDMIFNEGLNAVGLIIQSTNTCGAGIGRLKR